MEKISRLSEKEPKATKRVAKPGRPQVKPLEKCSESLTRKLAEGSGPPADRGACEKEATTQGSE